MPGQNSGWFHNSQLLPPAIPEAGEQHPEGTVDGPDPGAGPYADEARELVVQCEILCDEICPVLENGGNNGKDQLQPERHSADDSLSSDEQRTSANPEPYAITTKDTCVLLPRAGVAACIEGQIIKLLDEFEDRVGQHFQRRGWL
jgi:hypothetical protein